MRLAFEDVLKAVRISHCGSEMSLLANIFTIPIAN
jgi:hypothetical protein